VNASLLWGLLIGPSPLSFVVGLAASFAANHYASAPTSGAKDGGDTPSSQPSSGLKKAATIALVAAAVPVVAFFTAAIAGHLNLAAFAALGMLGPLLLGAANLLAAGALRKKTLSAQGSRTVRGLSALAVGVSSAVNVLLLSAALSHSVPIALALGAAAGTATGLHAAGVSVPNVSTKPLSPEAKKKLVEAGKILFILAVLALAVFLVLTMAWSAGEYLQQMNQQIGDPTNWDPPGF
jgi:hypothetical protein